MDLRLLEIFCAVYEERSFSRAARRLGLKQPTISGHVKALETHFGISLFDRLGREIAITRAGELLYERGRRIVELKREVAEEMDHFLDRLEGQMVVGASTIPGEYLLPGLVGDFHRAHPRLRVRIHIGDTRSVAEGVASGRYEAGFVGARMGPSSLLYERFAADRLVLIVPPEPRWRGVETISLAALGRERFVWREPGSGTRLALERRLAELGVAADVFEMVAELGSTTAVKEAVKAGVGCAFLSDLAVRTELAAGVVHQVAVDELGTLGRDFFAVVDGRRSCSPICRLFLDSVGAELAPGGAAAS